MSTGAVFGLDCCYDDCRHDSVRGYRLRLKVRPARQCRICKRDGQPIPSLDAVDLAELLTMSDIDLGTPAGRDAVLDWYRCSWHCVEPWRHRFQSERNDLLFRAIQLVSAKEQMVSLGVSDPDLGSFVVEGHASLPPFTDARLLILTEEPLPKTAVYFRWQPMANEVLTPDKVYQCNFAPDMPAHERVQAMARQLSDAEFVELTQANDAGMLRAWSAIRCQHCHRPLPLRAFNTSTLRECEYGD
jgi:hypothetical protein